MWVAGAAAPHMGNVGLVGQLPTVGIPCVELSQQGPIGTATMITKGHCQATPRLFGPAFLVACVFAALEQ